MASGRFSSKQIEQLRAWVSQQYRAEPLWRVRAMGTEWICPYCGLVGASAPPSQTLDGPILDHLAGACKEFAGQGAAPKLSLEEAKTRALGALVKKQLRANPAWHVRDSRDQWACPYCVQVTALRLPGGKVDATALAGITEHVLACPAFDPAQPMRFKPVTEVHQAVVAAVTRERIVERVAGMVRDQPLWRVRSANGHWACPYCKKPVVEVRVVTQIDLQENAPRKIALHLMEHCEAYRAKQAPAASTQELEAAVGGGKGADHGVLSPIRGRRDKDLASISQEMRAVREEMDHKAVEMERELVQAREKQLRMLPKLPRVAGLGLFVLYEPCSHLAGDFYDFVDLGHERLGIAIGDVTGHGVDAALVMGMCKKVLNMTARAAGSPAEAVSLANTEICKDLDGKTFVSLWYGVLELRFGVLRFVRAGHEPLLLYSPAGEEPLQVFHPGGMALGLTAGARFDDSLEPVEVQLDPGDLGLLYTDGVIEAATPTGDQLGRANVEALLARHGPEGPESVVQAVRDIVGQLNPGAPLADDLTMLAFRYQPDERARDAD